MHGFSHIPTRFELLMDPRVLFFQLGGFHLAEHQFALQVPERGLTAKQLAPSPLQLLLEAGDLPSHLFQLFPKRRDHILRQVQHISVRMPRKFMLGMRVQGPGAVGTIGWKKRRD